VTTLHIVLGIAVLVTNAAAAGWGSVAWLRHDPSVYFWYFLRVAQVAVVAEVIVGGILLARGDRAGDDLHFLYGIGALAVALVTEGMRVGAVQRETEGVEDVESLDRSEQVRIARRVVLREMGIMTVGTLLILTLSIRAFATGG
jgi:hypothetical protein